MAKIVTHFAELFLLLCLNIITKIDKNQYINIVLI